MADDRLNINDVKRVWDELGDLHVAIERVRSIVNTAERFGLSHPADLHFCEVVRTKMDEADTVTNQCSAFVKDFEIEEVAG